MMFYKFSRIHTTTYYATQYIMAFISAWSKLKCCRNNGANEHVKADSLTENSQSKMDCNKNGLILKLATIKQFVILLEALNGHATTLRHGKIF